MHDVRALNAVFKQGKRAYLLSPPADPSTDTAKEERAILAALESSGLSKVVAQSTCGAQPGAALGDLGVRYDFEKALSKQPIPAAIIRGACQRRGLELAPRFDNHGATCEARVRAR